MVFLVSVSYGTRGRKLLRIIALEPKGFVPWLYGGAFTMRGPLTLSGVKNFATFTTLQRTRNARFLYELCAT